MKEKSLFKHLLPPLFSQWYQNYIYRKKIRRGVVAEITGEYKSFREAVADSGTYDNEEYAQCCFKAYENEVVKKTWPVLPYDWPFLSNLALVLGRCQRLSVLDIGGASANYYFKLKGVLGKEAIQRWIVVENKKVVERMKKESVDFVEYADRFDPAWNANTVNLILISGTLQYLEEPFKTLEWVASIRSDFICVNKSILWDKPTRLAKQITPDAGRSSRPIWIFNEQGVKQKFKELNYRLLNEYENTELMTYLPAHGTLFYKGLFFEKNSESRQS